MNAKLIKKSTILAVCIAVAMLSYNSCKDDDDKPTNDQPPINNETPGDDDKPNTPPDTPSTTETTYLYAQTDMTWAEFYAADLNQPAADLQALGIDAVSSATNIKGQKFANAVFEADGENASKISGVKAVNVRIAKDIYDAMEDKSRYTLLETAPEEYKTVNDDGSFGASNSKVAQQTATATLLSGFDAKWGNYVISLDGLEGVTTNNLQGAILTTTDGAKYGLQFLNNLWLKPAEFTFCVKEFTEPHGCARAYKHTADLEGKTLKNITYILKDTVDISVDLDVFVKKQTAATVTPGDALPGENPSVKLNFADLPSDANYQLASVKKGSGKKATALSESDYTYANNTLTIKGLVYGNDVYTVSFVDDNYVNAGTTITFDNGIINQLTGSYVELFSPKGMCGDKWAAYWVECCKPYSANDEAATAIAQSMQASMQGTIYGAEAEAAYDIQSGNYKFNCYFINGVSTIKIDGRNITGFDNDGAQAFSHNYHFVKEVTDNTFGMTFSEYKSDDDNADEFTYFFFAGDTPATTYHIEFRYGTSEEDLLNMLSGKYAYWLAAGMIENNPDDDVKACIKLFCDENLGKE